MSGIAGFWNLEGKPASPEVLGAMSGRIRHRGPDGSGQWQDGPVGLVAHVLRVVPESENEIQPMVDPAAVLVFDGRLDNRDELLGRLKATGNLAEAPDPNLVLASYKKFGEGFLEHLNGEFALALFDVSRKKLMLARDPVGTRPLYYAWKGKTFLFASEIKGILASPDFMAEPDLSQIAELFLGAPHLDEKSLITFFKGIKSLLPSHKLVVTREGEKLSRYWDFDPFKQVRFKTFSEYAEAFKHYFFQSVKRRVRSAYPVSVAVSGGLDSSSILCVAQLLHEKYPRDILPPVGISFVSDDGSSADERRYLDAMEGLYPLQIKRIKMVPRFSREELEDNARKLEFPRISFFTQDDHIFSEAARAKSARVRLTGLWGDHFLVSLHYLIDLFYQFKWGKIWDHLMEFGQWSERNGKPNSPFFFGRFALEQFFKVHVPSWAMPYVRRLAPKQYKLRTDNPCYTETLRSFARAGFNRKPVREKFASCHAEVLYKTVRFPYSILNMEVLNKSAAAEGMEVSHPFLDKDLLSYLMAIPGEMVCQKGVLKGILREGLKGVLPELILGRRDKGDYSPIYEQALKESFGFFKAFFHENLKIVRQNYVSLPAIQKQVAGSFEPNSSVPLFRRYWHLPLLVALESWLNVHFDHRGRS